ncbi:MAG: cytochrome c [Acidobacteria bacterium]|nr:cytochrome c [Acidobacteriota bacterium]MBK8149827.1 cytochrome c [Acidobacteriota bacterium]MBK8809229.1 cytochrome c [Acidobacteriota bacterium]
MREVKLIIIVSAAALFIAACAAKEPPGQPRVGIVLAESKMYEASLYRQNCALCHGVEGYGKEMQGRMIPSLRHGDIASKTEEQIYEQIATGKPPMPSFKFQLTEEEMRRMAKFIYKDLQGRQ